MLLQPTSAGLGRTVVCNISALLLHFSDYCCLLILLRQSSPSQQLLPPLVLRMGTRQRRSTLQRLSLEGSQAWHEDAACLQLVKTKWVRVGGMFACILPVHVPCLGHVMRATQGTCDDQGHDPTGGGHSRSRPDAIISKLDFAS